MFASFQFDWPVSIQFLFNVFSFTNFNVELVAPECSLSFNYSQKWFTIQALPLLMVGIPGTIVAAAIVVRYVQLNCRSQRSVLLKPAASGDSIGLLIDSAIGVMITGLYYLYFGTLVCVAVVVTGAGFTTIIFVLRSSFCPVLFCYSRFLLVRPSTFVPCSARVVYPNGDTFEGTFNDARQKHGAGVYTWSTEEGSNPWLPEGGLPEDRVVKYEGSWVEGKRSGVGKITFPNGDRYHGALPGSGVLDVIVVVVVVVCCCGRSVGQSLSSSARCLDHVSLYSPPVPTFFVLRSENK